MHSDNPDELKEKRICIECVGDPYLKALIERARDEATCAYCEQTGATIEIGELADLVHAAFESHYVRTASEPSSFEYAMMSDRESTYDWEREGEPVTYAIMNAADIPEEAAEDIQKILEDENSSFDDAMTGEETPYYSDSHYQEKPASGADWQLNWDRFEYSLRTEARFFSREAENLLASVFAGIDSLQTATGSTVIVDAGPSTHYSHLYRARVFQSDEKLAAALKNLDLELGSPPEALAMAGRMNARGISVFYGATDPQTALAEIRPPVGSRVVVGRFDIVRHVRLLDLAALGDIGVDGSIFDPEYVTQLERAAFLRTLGQLITRPVMPDDEALDYLVTQAVADFLATNSPHPVDGIIYHSVQTKGEARNAVLFHKAACVERFDRPFGTEVESSLGRWDEDGWEIEYEVIESTPAPDAKEPEDPLDAMVFQLSKGLDALDKDGRDATLRLDRDTIRVHFVEAVTFKTSDQGVKHFRWEKTDSSPI